MDGLVVDKEAETLEALKEAWAAARREDKAISRSESEVGNTDGMVVEVEDVEERIVVEVCRVVDPIPDAPSPRDPANMMLEDWAVKAEVVDTSIR